MIINKKRHFFLILLILFTFSICFSLNASGSQNSPYFDSVSAIENHYGIILSNEKLQWNNGKAKILAHALDSINYVKSEKTLLTLENKQYKCGINVYSEGSTRYASLSVDIFRYSASRTKHSRSRSRSHSYSYSHSYKNESFLSKNLEKALLCLSTDFGRNKKETQSFLKNKFSIYLGAKSTISLTGENSSSFKDFTPRERMILLHTLLDLSVIMKDLPEGSIYLLRRRAGLQTPRLSHSSAPTALSHILSRNKGYIEFTDNAFIGPDSHSKLIFIHELMHFFVENVWSQDLLKQWSHLGSWYKNRSDMDQWSTQSERNFVSPYAHEVSPTEDLVESLAYYVVYPSYLKSIALQKYRFIQNHFLKNIQYFNRVPSFLRFQLENEFESFNSVPERVKDLKIISSSSQSGEVVLGIKLQPKVGRDRCQVAKVVLKMYDKDKIPFYVYFTSSEEGPCYLISRFHLPKNPKSQNDWILDSIQIYNYLGEVRFQNGGDFYFKLIAQKGFRHPSSIKANEEKRPQYTAQYNANLYPVQLLVETLHFQPSELNSEDMEPIVKVRVQFQVRNRAGSRLKKIHFYLSDPRGIRYRFVVSPTLVEKLENRTIYRTNIFLPKGIQRGEWSLREAILETKKGSMLPYNFVERLF